jgi:hypothetical protein
MSDGGLVPLERVLVPDNARIEIALQKKVDLNFVYPLAENYDHVV